MAFFKFITVFIIIVIVAIAVSFFWLFRKVNKITSTFTGGNKRTRSQQRNSGNRTYGNKEGVIDARTPEQANRKIFKDNEGEYVDFTEVNE